MLETARSFHTIAEGSEISASYMAVGFDLYLRLSEKLTVQWFMYMWATRGLDLIQILDVNDMFLILIHNVKINK